VGKNQSDTKTQASADELPLQDSILEELRQWKDISAPKNGWVFESPIIGRPYHAGILQRNYLREYGKKAGIPRLGWHAFRHTYRAMLRDLDAPIEIQKLLMRHADIRTTTMYGGKKTNLKPHNAAVVEIITREKKQA
jgi:integrase